MATVVLVTLAVSAHGGGTHDPAAFLTPTPSPSATVKPTPTATPTPQDAVFSIVAAGDVLPHADVVKDATKADGTYDFTTELSGLDRWVQGADLALCHMEVPVAPPGTAVSTYPSFGAPPSLVKDLAAQGWDGCSTASNHSMDRGFDGVKATLATFDADHLGHAGTGRTTKEVASPQLYRLERDGQTVTVAHLSATFGLNNLAQTGGKAWSVERIDTSRLVAQAKAARKAGADVVLASIHDGTEYDATPTADQKKVMKALARSGQIDAVLGAHAHVPQPVAKLSGGVGGRGMWVAYGMGNMLSNQDSDCCVAQTDSGLLVTVTVTKAPGAAARVTGFEWTPLTVDRTGGHRVYAIPDVLGRKGGVGKLSHAELAARLSRVKDVVGTAAPERTTAPKTAGTVAVVLPHAGAPKS
ncbi:CapA family protein [Luteimicrobium sp. DT211]|uniref:CapA family protein n=1 Tax=Luteimicrobium sp. DT211 TaxID=3393412 RepID=UPI003CF2897C